MAIDSLETRPSSARSRRKRLVRAAQPGGGLTYPHRDHRRQRSSTSAAPSVRFDGGGSYVAEWRFGLPDCKDGLGLHELQSGEGSRLNGRSWRREWDSNFPTSFRFCNLQIRQCHGCHECQRCRRALPAIARSRSGPAVRAGRRRGSPQNVSGNRSSRPRTPSRIRPDLPFRIQSKCFHVDAGRSVRASPRLAGSGVFAPPRRSPSSRACRLA